MNYLKIKKTKTLNIVSSMLVIFLMMGCSIRIIAPYDSVTDEKIAELQVETITKLIEWERTNPVPPLKDEYAFYDNAETVVAILIARNKDVKKSENINDQLTLIQENFTTLKKAHKTNLLSPDVIKQIQGDFMAQFNAVQKFQMALKRYEEKNK